MIIDINASDNLWKIDRHEKKSHKDSHNTLYALSGKPSRGIKTTQKMSLYSDSSPTLQSYRSTNSKVARAPNPQNPMYTTNQYSINTLVMQINIHSALIEDYENNFQ